MAMRTDRTKSLERAITLLERLAHTPAIGLSGLARQAALPKATAFRLLATLGHHELTSFDSGSESYRLGPRVLLWAEAMRGGSKLRARARLVLERLRARTNETVGLVERFGVSRVCVMALPSEHELQAIVRVGLPKPIHIGAPGKVFLAYLPDQDVQDICRETRLPPLTAKSVRSPNVLRRQVEAIAARGFARTVGESVPGMYSLAVPVFDADASVIAALALFAPAVRVHRAREQSWVKAFKQASAELSRELGFQKFSSLSSGGSS